jgi:hypothetical protein
MNLNGFRFIGNSLAKPSAAIDMYQLSTDGNINAKNHIEDIYIGSFGGFDSDDAAQFTAGISFSGDNNNNEQNYFNNIYISKVGTGIDIASSAYSNNCLDNISVDNATVAAINSQSNTIGHNWIFSYNAIDITFGSGRTAVNGLSSEYSGRLAEQTGVGPASLEINGKYFLITDEINGDGMVIKAVGNSTVDTYTSVDLSNFLWVKIGGYGGPTPTISIKSNAGGNAWGLLRLSNVTGILAENVDMGIDFFGGGGKRIISVRDGVNSGENVFTAYGQTVDFNRWDIPKIVSGVIPALDDSGTPSVLAGNVFLTGGTTAITDFDDGMEGQEIKIISEHAITITDGTNIFLNGSANFVMAASDTLTLICKADNKWYELSRSVN